MRSRSRPRRRNVLRSLLAVFCAALLVPAGGAPLAQAPAPAPGAAPDATPEKIPAEKLDSLVAPIALYPDPLLAQTLVASTYPLEIIQLQQWMAKNKDLKDKALEEAVAKQPWDPSIQSMAAFPDVVKRLGDDIQWTTDLGNAFLEQQSDVMDAVQRMRTKAQGAGALATSEQQVVETKVIEQKTVIVVEPADPEVIYVPSYNPVVVYGPPLYYPYPPIYYPPPGAYWGAAAITFGVGVAMGARWGGACCGCGWGRNNVNINVNNNFNRNANINTGGNNNWQHNSQHRGGAPYSSKATASKYGGSTQGGSRQGGASASNRASGGASGAGGASASNRASGGASGAGGASASNRASGGASGAGGASASNRGSSSAGAGGGASKSSGGYGGSSGGFGGGSGGYSGSSANASSSRGASSMSSGGGGYRGGGGGGRGGGGRR